MPTRTRWPSPKPEWDASSGGNDMKRVLTVTAVSLTIMGAAPAWAQAGAPDLMAMDVGSLRGEIQSRYDAALARSVDPAIVNANDSRYIWANEAKVQCGIAIGF